MAQVINTNVASINAQRNLNRSQNDLSTSLQRLSSGLRINSAKDDAAGLAISDRMTSQIRGSTQASRNANDGISLAQTAEGALGESTSILQRVRELAIQSANSTNSSSDRLSLQAEVNQLVSELDRISQATTFNGLKLLDGSFQAQSFHIGADANQSVNVTIGEATSANLGIEKVSTLNNIKGIEMATSGFHADVTNTPSGQSDIAADLTTATGALIATQQLKVSDQNGNIQTLEIDPASAIAASRDAADITNKLNELTGVSASATNSAKFELSSLSIQSGDVLSFNIVTGDIDAAGKPAYETQNISINYNPATFDADFDQQVTDAVKAINSGANNTDLSFDPLTKTINSASGVNLGIESFAVEDNPTIKLSNFTNNTTNADGGGYSFKIDGQVVNVTISIAGASQEQIATKVKEAIDAQTLLTDVTATVSGDSVFVTRTGGAATNLTITELIVKDNLGAANAGDNDGGGFTVSTDTGTSLAGVEGQDTVLVDNGVAAPVHPAVGEGSGAIIGTVANSTIEYAGNTLTEGGSVAAVQIGTYSIILDSGYNIQSSVAQGADGLLNAGAATDVALAAGAMSDTSAGNFVASQQLTMTGTGTQTVSIKEDATAKDITELVNAVADTTGVTATARTTATLSHLSADALFHLN